MAKKNNSKKGLEVPTPIPTPPQVQKGGFKNAIKGLVAGVVSTVEKISNAVLGKPAAITRADAVTYIKSGSKGKIFGVNFTKRTNGELRVMTCRYGVRAYVKGVGLKFDPDKKNLIVVYDMIKRAYRMIAIEGIRGILIAGRFHKVK